MKRSKKLNMNAAGILIGIGLLIGAMVAISGGKNSKPTSTSVMITNNAKNSGGSGVILTSSATKSSILTNSHVCGVVESGGLVVTSDGEYQVAEYTRSQSSDLCLITVNADLNAETAIAESAPKMFESASVVGHPALLPTVVTNGHFSGRKSIDIMTGVRPCSKEERSGELSFICFLLGGMPVITHYETIVVTATIMPGSSGSGVFNSKNELMALVFAGGGGLSYAFTVPLEQVRNFLETELKTAVPSKPKSSFGLSELISSSKVRRTCVQRRAESEAIDKLCSAIERSLIWSG